MLSKGLFSLRCLRSLPVTPFLSSSSSSSSSISSSFPLLPPLSRAFFTLPHRQQDDSEKESLAPPSPSSPPSLASLYFQVKNLQPSKPPASPEWEEALTKAHNIIPGGTSFSMKDARQLVGKDLASLTKNIHQLIDTQHPVLKTAARIYFDQGGKHFRPLLVLLVSMATNRCLGPSHGTADAILGNQRRLAEITEMIHTASLLHDDVIDTADTRRGKPSVNVAFGNKMAVLAGDYLLAKASIALAQLQNLRVVDLLATVIANLVEGEVMQMKSDPSNFLNFDYYLQKTYLKTATLIAKSCQAAVLLAGQKEEISNIAYEYGKNLGIAFQLVDDMLDFTGTEQELGKPAAADLELGLVTAPVLFAAEESPEILPLIQRQFQQKGDPHLAREIVLRGKAIERTRQMAQEYSQKAIEAIIQLPESEARNCLISLTENVVTRKS